MAVKCVVVLGMVLHSKTYEKMPEMDTACFFTV